MTRSAGVFMSLTNSQPGTHFLTRCPNTIMSSRSAKMTFPSVCGQDEIERQGSVLVDYADLTVDKMVHKALPELITELKEQPEVILNCLGLAIHQVNTHKVSSLSFSWLILITNTHIP